MSNGDFPILSDPAYRIEEELGSGGGSVVYKAWHSRLQKYVVLKRIKDESGLLQHGRQRVEVDILKNLKHPHLPQLYDFLDDRSGVYTVMEFIPGKSFSEMLNEGFRFEQKYVVSWAERLSGALAYLHGLNPPVLHSDIKPGNIMLTPEGDICLIDFNVSLVLDGESAKTLGMSHGYASPEQYGPLGLPSDMQIPPGSSSPIASESPAPTTAPTPAPAHAAPTPTPARRYAKIRMDTRSDIYSLGATLYHLATGERPEIATGSIKPLSEFANVALSDAFIYIIERCMERDPAKRFQTAADLHAAIANIHRLDGRWKRQRARTAIAAAVLAACLIASGSAVAAGWQRMGSEKAEKYNNLVIEIAGDRGDSAYEGAIALFPENPGAYREQAVKLCAPGSYESCIDYVDGAMAMLSAFPCDESGLRLIGDMYYAQGNAYFELDDYPGSLPAYEAAIANNPDNPDMHRDYAIALARCGYINRAEELLGRIQDYDIGYDSVDLLKGEIAYAKGEDDRAIRLFEAVIGETDSDYIRNRAYLICDKAYRRAPDLVGDEITLLRGALRDLPGNYLLALKERLADALVRTGEYAEAAELFEELRLEGNMSYSTWQNIGVLYQQMGDYAGARKVYLELSEAFPDDYRPPMRLAYLELEEQAALPNEERDYSWVARLYEQALDVYKGRPKSAGDDMEMLQLDSLVSELRRNGWLDTVES